MNSHSQIHHSNQTHHSSQPHHSREQHGSNKHDHMTQHFPIVKPGLCGTNPKFPYRDARHYVDPCCDFPKKCQIGYTAQLTLKEPHDNLTAQCHSPELPTSHPWFEPTTP